MKNIFCEDPSIIYNRACTPYLFKYGYIYTGCQKQIRNFDDVGDLERYFSSLTHQLDEDELDKYGYVDEFGVWYPLYIKVPCRHCLLCRYSYSTTIAQRVEFEANDNQIVPLFATLTYKPKTYVDDVEVCKRDAQLFKKRLQTFVRRLGFKNKLKFVNVIERGTKFNRMHHHLIILNMPNLYEVFNLNIALEPILRYIMIHYHWRLNKCVRCKGFRDYLNQHLNDTDNISEKDLLSRGICHIRKLDNSKNASKYISTYISASRVYCSQNLGVSFAKKLFTQSTKNEVEYFDVISCSAKKASLTKYYIDKFLPTISKVFYPVKFMRKIRHYQHNISLLLSAPISMVKKHLRRYIMQWENVKYIYNHIPLEVIKLPINKDFFASIKLNRIFAELEDCYDAIMNTNDTLQYQSDNMVLYREKRDKYLATEERVLISEYEKTKLIKQLSTLKKYL